jgi:pilus assembly protein CpaF
VLPTIATPASESFDAASFPARPFVARPPGAARAPSPVRVGVAALGPLSALASDPTVTDILVNGSLVWVDRGRGLERVASLDLPASATRELAVRLVGFGGRHVDESTPTADARLPGGIRVHAVLSPVAIPSPLLSIRLAAPDPLGLGDLEAAGAIDAGMRGRLERLVATRTNVLVTGAAGTGKTTLLAAMLA